MNSSQISFPMPSSPLKYCLEVLPSVSRSFAIGIRALGSGKAGRSVLVGYLLCRIIDTIEDDLLLPASEKQRLLEKFPGMLAGGTEQEAGIADYTSLAVTGRLSGNVAHMDLVRHTQTVFALYESLPQSSREILQERVSEMARGMASFVAKYPNGVRIRTLQEYGQYCYYVAGTVGHLLTGIWREHALFVRNETFAILSRHATAFGEALQTVNILKDIAEDATAENSIYIPLELLERHGVSHGALLAGSEGRITAGGEAALRELLSLARTNLAAAADYVQAIPQFHVRIRFFCILPLLLALATLREIASSSNIINPGRKIKVSRQTVARLVRVSVLASSSNIIFRKALKWAEEG